MFTHRADPRAEEVRQRLGKPHSFSRMGLNHLELFVRELPWLGQNFRRDTELADVMDESCPLQLVAVVLAQAHLFANQRGVRADSLGVSTSEPIMLTETCSEFDDETCSVDLIATKSARFDLTEPFLQPSSVT